MMLNFFKRYKQSKMVKEASTFILGEFADIVALILNELEEKGDIKDASHKEVLRFESTAFLFWLFQKTHIFPRSEHKLILDALHDQYFSNLKQHCYDSRMRQAVCDDLNLRYTTYSESFSEIQDLTKCAFEFASFVSKRTKIDLNTKSMTVPLRLYNIVAPKFEEWAKTTLE